jgi:restriction endonuclease S subunit
MIFSIIQKSQLEGAHRLDAEYYQPEYLDARRLVSSSLHVSLGEISAKFRKGIFDIKADTYTTEGVPFIRISNLKDGLLDDQEIIFISRETNQKEKATVLQDGDLVLSKTAYPAASLVSFDQANISQDIIGISIKNEWRSKVLSAFVVAFLNSKFGMLEMQQWFQGNIQMHLALSDAKTILIPLLPLETQQEIAGLFEESKNRLDIAKSVYSQAENLLLEELGLNNYEVEDDLSYIVNLSEIQSAHRADAEYFQPKYKALESRITNYESRKLGEIAKRKTIRVKVSQEIEYNYVEIGDVNVGSGVVSFTSTLGRELPANAKIKINGGELIVSKVRPTRGAIAIIPDDWNKNFVASGAFSVFDVMPPLREYLQVILRSVVGKLQLKKPTTGTSYPTVTDEDVENLLVPVLPVATQQKIADLVRKSHEARTKAKESFEEAKHKVEKIIEAAG